MFFKAGSWSVGFVFVPKGDSRLFIINELVGNIYMLIFNMLGYFYFGLEGLGISFLLGYIIYFFQVYIICHNRYSFSFDNDFICIFIVQSCLAIGSFTSVIFLLRPYSFLTGSLCIIVSSIISIRELDKRIGIKEIALNMLRKIQSR